MSLPRSVLDMRIISQLKNLASTGAEHPCSSWAKRLCQDVWEHPIDLGGYLMARMLFDNAYRKNEDVLLLSYALKIR